MARNPAATTAVSADPQRPHLNLLHRAFYASGDFGNCFAYSMINMFLLFFMTDIAKINPTTVGTVMLLSKVWDAGIDPFIGTLADRTRTKWGRYRPWVIGSAIPMVILNVLAFTTFSNWSEGARAIWAFSAYVLSVTAYSCLNIPYSAMAATLTLDGDTRAKVASTRESGAMLATLFLSFFALRIVNAIKASSGSEAAGYQTAAIIFGAISLPFFFLCFFKTKEVVHTETAKEKFFAQFYLLKKNVPFWCLTWFFIDWGLNAFGSSMLMYYFTYYADKQIMYANNSTIATFGTLLGTLSLTFLIKYFKNKGHLMAFFALGSCGLASIAFFIPVRTTFGQYWYYLNSFLNGFCRGCVLASMFAIQPDVCEYTRYHFGVYAAGFLSAFTNFCFQFGGALATACSGWLLGGIGYVAGQAQPDNILMIFRVLPHFWPALMMLIGSIIMFKYPLSKVKFNEITEKLQKGEYAPGVVPASK
jgi:sugar (glycoside-pentoside-hexuronide) transporter